MNSNIYLIFSIITSFLILLSKAFQVWLFQKQREHSKKIVDIFDRSETLQLKFSEVETLSRLLISKIENFSSENIISSSIEQRSPQKALFKENFQTMNEEMKKCL